MELLISLVLVVCMFCYQGFNYLFEMGDLKKIEEMEKNIKLIKS